MRLAGAVAVLPVQRVQNNRSQPLSSLDIGIPSSSSTSSQDSRLSTTMIPESDFVSESDSSQSEGLIMPRKIVNPCLESSERRDLHRELAFNNKIGKNVLGQKTELQKAMERHRQQQLRKDAEQERLSSKSTLEKTLEERARRLEQLNSDNHETKAQDERDQAEFLQVHARLRNRNPNNLLTP